ncbi:conserved hypothetical protein [Theileria equi strain WA]|uniref:Uncharacterized protein n=1 Tax=Theileria equi strain WA TaxID=1537102 RepID=L1LDM7_THEEQ|nr:conserved hypothetical protein [Theileria equi strain WA]EKX73379.1 conserved hypothetical protein [Theileria equi strain WA]|eukprot:XP_004832831.1 conserved hypothetical protein [Theileria equi strain WA]
MTRLFSLARASRLHGSHFRRYFSFVDERRLKLAEQRPSVRELDVDKEILTGERRREIRRADFLKFTGGKRPLISSHLKGNIIAIFLGSWCIVAGILCLKMFKPESYEWLENERKRIEAAKEKLELIKQLESNAKNAPVGPV